MADKIQLRRDTAANWTTANPVLAQGEEGYELDTGKRKVGDGVTTWNSLAYDSGGGITDHGNLLGLGDDDHPQYLNETRHDALPSDNPHGVTKAQVGLSNVPNVDATDRANHTGTQLASTISDFAAAVQNAETVSTLVESPPGTFTYTDEDNVTTVFSAGGVTDHGALSGLGDDDHTQYLNITRHNAIGGNPHGVTKNDVNLGNVPNIDATDRSNHTGTQLANTISNFDAEVSNNSDVTANTAKVSFPEAPNDGQQYARQSLGWSVFSGSTPIFGSEFQDFSNLTNVNITTGTLFPARTFTTASKPTGRYRIELNVHLQPGSASSNYLAQLRINGTQIGLEAEVEGKDIGSDIRVPEYFVGYYDHVGPGTFDIELWAAREGGTMVIHGVEAAVWRVS